MSKTALFAAAKDWDARAVRRSLADAPDLVDARDARGRTALHICAGSPLPGHVAPPAASIATARELLTAGTDVNVVHEIPDGREIFPATPLWYALARGRNRPLARFLLKEGANPDHCLWTVIWSREPDLVRLLLRAGSRPNVRFDGETPLIYAARLGRDKELLALVAAGADIKAQDAKGRTAADHARRKRLSPAVLAVLNGPRGAGTARVR